MNDCSPCHADATRECSACKVDLYYNQKVRMLLSKCDHLICEPCVERLFQPGPYRCPTCEQPLCAGDFCPKPMQARQAGSEAQVRRKICEIYCRVRRDFPIAEEYHDYLVRREDIIERLLIARSQDQVHETWQEVEQYQEQQAEQISQARAAPRSTFRATFSIVDDDEPHSASFGQLPLKKQFLGWLAQPSDDGRDSRQVSPAGSSPCATNRKSPNTAEHMSGGGHQPEALLKKARHFLVKDLVCAIGELTKAGC
eukprot:CAMPEP_0177286428 /NCGR_PEP_ID=MMETSP0367-20130122/73614_1 /TAXON_ID=447022 ORGANISM="Scrippsiella hangoei-like, Strain SHHI-4" /NCGR_SAMPLE_ID=MMETSP0367 /ASSEMBLY_ACC=CAM_ASM_000362 /LENGTH=254 /DNA_ID=CAMNT_0018743667 /DNA_START=36 /DNA_END=800 /DNA_ORIENTATION=-